MLRRAVTTHITTLKGGLRILQHGAMMNQLVFKMHFWRDWALRRIFAKHVLVQLLNTRLTKILCTWKNFANIKSLRRCQRRSAQKHFHECKRAQARSPHVAPFVFRWIAWIHNKNILENFLGTM